MTEIMGGCAVGASPLRRAIKDAQHEDPSLTMGDLTVLAIQNDPFRLDTPAQHRAGAWLAVQLADLGLASRKIHLRGLHYKLINRIKPDGTAYVNTDDEWEWMSETAAKAARWLGYVDFEQISDERNSPPEVHEFKRPNPFPYISVGIDVDIPSVEDIEPGVGVWDFKGTQPYKIVLVGEKSSLADVLGPIARQYQADLYLPTGEISDTLAYRMASVANADGRPMVVLYFSDGDPAGWQMPISLARKLQALRVIKFPALDFQIRRAALTPVQVRDLGLPSSPLKEKEKRADDWQATFGIAQTEIDALLSLRPGELEHMARKSIAPFFDSTLEMRVLHAYGVWIDEAGTALAEQVDGPWLEQVRIQAEAKLDQLRAEIDAINDALRIDPGDITLPEVVVPEAEPPGDEVYGLPCIGSGWDFAEPDQPVIDSDWSFAEQTQQLKCAKSYGATS